MNIPPTPDPGPEPSAVTPPPPTPQPKRLRRKKSSSIAGVASGLAGYLGIPTKWIRIGLIVGLMFGGASFFLYLAAWVAVPTEADPDPRPLRLTGDVGRLIIGGVFAALGVAAMTGGTVAVSGSLILPVLLIGIGYAILNQTERDTSAMVGTPEGGVFPKAPRPVPPSEDPDMPVPPPAGSAPPGIDAAQSNDAAGPEAAAPQPATSGEAEPPDPPADVAPPTSPDRDPLLVEADRLRSIEGWGDLASPEPFDDDPSHWALTRTEAATAEVSQALKPPIVLATLAMAAVAIGVVAVFSQFFGFSFGTGRIALLVLLFSIAGFVVGRFFRTGWSLIPVALIALFAMITAPIIDIAVADGVGDRQFRVSEEDLLRDEYRLGAGDLELDLSGLTLSADRTVDVELGAGDMRIFVPDEVPVTVHALSEYGETVVGDISIAGTNNEVSAQLNSEATGPRLTVNATTTFGVVTVDSGQGIRASRLPSLPSVGGVDSVVEPEVDVNEPVGVDDNLPPIPPPKDPGN